MFWTNSSVALFAGDKDPVAAIEQVAREKVFSYLESGGTGPPFNPLALASFLGITTLPTNDIRDARTLFRHGKLEIEFNPNRPKSRINYSIAHEIAHTFFPDCKEAVRNRHLHQETQGDEWQLETLCNIAAAEMLIPASDVPSLEDPKISIEALVDMRARFGVSMEALLLRLVRTARRPTYIFAASRINPDKAVYKIDYAVSSNRLLSRLNSGVVLPTDSKVGDCTAIGHTARAREVWKQSVGPLSFECVGIPPFPGQPFPRVVGFARTAQTSDSGLQKVTTVRGDATKPRGAGPKIVAFIVNDATPRWGAGFALAVKSKWPEAQQDFIRWHGADPRKLTLGNVHFFEADHELIFAEMICQHGYGPSARPRLRYASLEECLTTVATEAIRRRCTVHMPMIGSGQAGGNWSVVSDLIDRVLAREGIEVLIYELGHQPRRKNEQINLLFSR